MVRRLLIVVLAAVVIATACSPAATPEVLTEISVVELDLASSDGLGYPEATGPILEDGVRYVFDAQGTYSIWTSEWSGGTCKGTSESEPMFPSPGGANGQVGLDPEFWFAIPNGSSLCFQSGFVVPNHTGGIEMSFDGGVTYDDMDPIDGRPEAPSADHGYRYEVIGEGEAFRVRREDAATADDYGVIRFTIYRVD